MSLKVKSDDIIGLAIYGFLLMVNSNIGPNSAPLRDIRLCNLSDLEFDLSRSFIIIVYLSYQCLQSFGLWPCLSG